MDSYPPKEVKRPSRSLSLLIAAALVMGAAGSFYLAWTNTYLRTAILGIDSGNQFKPVVRHARTNEEAPTYCYDDGSQFCERSLSPAFAKEAVLGYLAPSRTSDNGPALYSCAPGTLSRAGRYVRWILDTSGTGYRVETDAAVCQQARLNPWRIGYLYTNPDTAPNRAVPLVKCTQQSSGSVLLTDVEQDCHADGFTNVQLLGYMNSAGHSTRLAVTSICDSVQQYCSEDATPPLCNRVTELCDETAVSQPITPTITPRPTITPSPEPIVTSTAAPTTPSPTVTGAPTPTSTATPAPSITPTPTPSPTPTATPTSTPNSSSPERDITVSAGHQHACAIIDGAAYCWGSNEYGQLGLGSGDHAKDRLTAVPGLSSGVTAISAGYQHTCAIHNGAAKCWGALSWDFDGRVTDIHYGPGAVSGLTSGVTAISASARHTCAIHNGAAKCWGQGYRVGELGYGSIEPSQAPVQVTGLTSGVTAIAAGMGHTCAIHNGAAKCWGWNAFGQLAATSIPTTNNEATVLSASTTTPVLVQNMSELVTAITSGEAHTCAIKQQKVYCWGLTYGQTPTEVSGANQVSHISAGANHNCIINNNGTPLCQGSNADGQLGTGQTGDRTTSFVPTRELTTGVRSIDAGSQHSCAATSDALWCWGRDGYGLHGQGPNQAPQRPAPVQVPLPE